MSETCSTCNLPVRECSTRASARYLVAKRLRAWGYSHNFAEQRAAILVLEIAIMPPLGSVQRAIADFDSASWEDCFTQAVELREIVAMLIGTPELYQGTRSRSAALAPASAKESDVGHD